MSQAIIAFVIIGSILGGLAYIYLSVWLHPEDYIKRPPRKSRRKKKKK